MIWNDYLTVQNSPIWDVELEQFRKLCSDLVMMSGVELNLIVELGKDD
jgi:hypothetical protein